MRSVRDRIRHALLFEAIGLAIVIVFGGPLFGLSTADIGVIAVGSATVATVWNYIYNLGFDHAMRRLTGQTRKGLWVRVGHAVLFEAGLLIILLPPIAWYLNISLAEAFIMDLAIAAFYVAYAFLFNLAYDRVFPIPPIEPQPA
ncbi:PACE efflux transporter [Roseococcus pinisoli]|uniref:PACE efflux transporter n=1 Tax=Roseococcus pinisoli TaxID=2835040 RepID=A0ABS5QJ06_9PROT|nr:PACE efflux transporter [Roseococcus pinisoli]MBS7813493.1 PACE efflux transporter [Roseococcus pinisoli]